VEPSIVKVGAAVNPLGNVVVLYPIRLLPCVKASVDDKSSLVQILSSEVSIASF
jgi:hypothetical protein